MPDPVSTQVVVPAEQEAEPDYLDRLRAAILANRVYPRQARRKRQQGTVVVSFAITSDGTIGQIELSSSTGIDSLDKAAISAVSGVGQFEAFPETIVETSKTISVPISFILR